jgi:hypothetical protein
MIAWKARYPDKTIDSPHYGYIDRSRPFTFELYANRSYLVPFLEIPVPQGKRLVWRKRHRRGSVALPEQTIVALESEDRSEVAVWVIESNRWVRHESYTAGVYPPELFDFETVTGDKVIA